MRAILVGLAAGLVSACVSVQPRPPVALSSPQEAEVKRAILAEINDASSARFGSFKAVSHPNGDVGVCGFMNAKNSLGAYPGPKPFIGTLRAGTFHVVSIGDSNAPADVVHSSCRQLGMGF